MLDPTDQRVIDDIARFGWHLVGVPADEKGPAFAYTVGLVQTLGHPEVIIFGLSIDTMWRILNTVGSEIRRGRSFAMSGTYDGLINNFPCKFGPVDERFDREFLGYAIWYARHVGEMSELSAVQCLWPDKLGRFPDDPAFDASIRSLQPVLFQNS